MRRPARERCGRSLGWPAVPDHSVAIRHFARAKFVHLVRDGRDTVCSIRMRELGYAPSYALPQRKFEDENEDKKDEVK